MELQNGECFYCKNNKVISLSSKIKNPSKIICSLFSKKVLNVEKFKNIQSSIKFCPMCYHKLILLEHSNDKINHPEEENNSSTICSLCGKDVLIFEVSDWKHFEEISNHISFTNKNKCVCSHCLFYLDTLNDLKRNLFSKYPELEAQNVSSTSNKNSSKLSAFNKNGTTFNLRSKRLPYTDPIEIIISSDEEVQQNSIDFSSLKNFRPLEHNKSFKNSKLLKNDPKLCAQIPYTLVKVSKQHKKIFCETDPSLASKGNESDKKRSSTRRNIDNVESKESPTTERKIPYFKIKIKPRPKSKQISHLKKNKKEIKCKKELLINLKRVSFNQNHKPYIETEEVNDKFTPLNTIADVDKKREGKKKFENCIKDYSADKVKKRSIDNEYDSEGSKCDSDSNSNRLGTLPQEHEENISEHNGKPYSNKKDEELFDKQSHSSIESDGSELTSTIHTPNTINEQNNEETSDIKSMKANMSLTSEDMKKPKKIQQKQRNSSSDKSEQEKSAKYSFDEDDNNERDSRDICLCEHERSCYKFERKSKNNEREGEGTSKTADIEDKQNNEKARNLDCIEEKDSLVLKDVGKLKKINRKKRGQSVMFTTGKMDVEQEKSEKFSIDESDKSNEDSIGKYALKNKKRYKPGPLSKKKKIIRTESGNGKKSVHKPSDDDDDTNESNVNEEIEFESFSMSEKEMDTLVDKYLKSKNESDITVSEQKNSNSCAYTESEESNLCTKIDQSMNDENKESDDINGDDKNAYEKERQKKDDNSDIVEHEDKESNDNVNEDDKNAHEEEREKEDDSSDIFEHENKESDDDINRDDKNAYEEGREKKDDNSDIVEHEDKESNDNINEDDKNAHEEEREKKDDKSDIFEPESRESDDDKNAHEEEREKKDDDSDIFEGERNSIELILSDMFEEKQSDSKSSSHKEDSNRDKDNIVDSEDENHSQKRKLEESVECEKKKKRVTFSENV